MYKKYLSKSIFQGKNNKAIYLTFDDGPTPEVTQFVLDELKKHHAKATFFCIGDKITRYSEVFEKVLHEGHTVGNHSFNHLNGWKTTDELYFENIEKCAQQVNSKLFRPPYGSLTKQQERFLSEKYDIVLWSLISYDFDPKLNVKIALESLKSKTKGGDIIVFHDSDKAYNNLKLMLPEYLQFCAQQGYEFCTL